MPDPTAANRARAIVHQSQGHTETLISAIATALQEERERVEVECEKNGKLTGPMLKRMRDNSCQEERERAARVAEDTALSELEPKDWMGTIQKVRKQIATAIRDQYD